MKRRAVQGGGEAEVNSHSLGGGLLQSPEHGCPMATRCEPQMQAMPSILSFLVVTLKM